jgi:hypothetical protein
VRPCGELATVAPQTILTDFLVDRVYPVQPRDEATVVAEVKEDVVGTLRRFESGGTATFLGYRPRDDQSRSLGYETRHWWEVLNVLGAYPSTGRFPEINDNTEYVSRTTDYLACRFPNGSIAIARHFRAVEEGWPGGFARNEEEDKRYVADHPLPPDDLTLEGFRVQGHTVDFHGTQALAFRVDTEGNLLAFAGVQSDRITVDGRSWVYSDSPLPLVAWAPVPESRRVPGGAVAQLLVQGAGTVRIPRVICPQRPAVYAEGSTMGSRGAEVTARLEDNALAIDIDGSASGRWLWIVAGE